MITAHCLHHPEREAVARCPSCLRPFCRECITEHEGRVLCARCLARTHAPAAVVSHDLRRRTAPLALAAGLLSAWLLFYALGRMLLALPDDVHDGTRWSQLSATAGTDP